jgi:uncharacterized protein YjbI with pentapeptide repeats
MANPEHIKILKQGVKAWNAWRVSAPEAIPNLGNAILNYKNLKGVNFDNTLLPGARLYEADLSSASLRGANLSNTYLRNAKLSNADLSAAIVYEANLIESVFLNVSLKDAFLHGADFINMDLRGADFSNAFMDAAVFSNVDLRSVKGLESIRHRGPSMISVDTIYNSKGNIPEKFLRGCGLPESFIIQIPALVAAMQPIQFYSCFISYSSKDQEFADRLHADLQSKGVRVWFAPHDMPIGARLRPAIDESIRLHDKLLLVLSESSVSSQWVEQEVETALSREREQDGKTVLFPVRIDDAVMEIKSGWPALLKNTRNVGDFTRWKDHDSYRKAFDRLLRDLKAET